MKMDTNRDSKILSELALAFESNQRIRSMIANKDRYYQGTRSIIAYCYYCVKKLNGVYVAKDNKTYLLYFRNSEFYLNISDMIRYAYMAVSVVGLPNIYKIYLREKRIKAIRQQQCLLNAESDYLYVWFLGNSQSSDDISGLVDIKKHIINKAKELNLPIYFQTTDARLLNMYRRGGFEFYRHEVDPELDLDIYFGYFCPTRTLGKASKSTTQYEECHI